MADNVQEFDGTAWTTTFALGQLGDYDLQVKPGYLVDPGGTYRYWHPSGYSSGTYKYYIRRFQTSGTKSSMTVNLNNTTLVAWNSTSNGIACAILFKSSGKESGTNNSLSTARIYDPTATTSNLIEADIFLRLGVVILCVTAFYIFKKNLVYPTILSAIILTVLIKFIQ